MTIYRKWWRHQSPGPNMEKIFAPKWSQIVFRKTWEVSSGNTKQFRNNEKKFQKGVKLCRVKAHFRRRAETRRAEKILAWLSSAWHASILDDGNLAVLKNITDDML